MLSPLRARKSDNYRYRDSWKSDNFTQRETLKKNQRTDFETMQRGFRVITLQGAIEKSQILLLQYWKMNLGLIQHNYFRGYE